MNVITIESEAFSQIIEKINAIDERFSDLENKSKNHLSEKWLDNQDVIELLKTSKRTLQSYRDEGRIPYSQIGHKVYYKAKDVEKFLKSNYQQILGF